ncbi:MAG: O-antigen ligase family protein [Candidatus Omnitrophica bacterium]|nr:O-antigen ligase family protein [Candidatus Omnitrophota bacterium]
MKNGIPYIWVDRLGMAAIAMVSVGYVLFWSSFAQVHLKFSFLDFPVFIGEILLGVAFLLFTIKSVAQKRELGRWGWVVVAYFCFVLFKAFMGYFVWGPLAFRDAALFYYPFFVVLGYSFWSNELWSDNIRRLGLALILLIFILQQFYYFWPCSLVILGVILALQIKRFEERMIWIGGVFVLAPYGEMINPFLRTVFVSSLITMIFIVVLFAIFSRRNRHLFIMGMVLGGLLLGAVLFKASQTGVLGTFIIKDEKPLVSSLPREVHRGRYLFHPVGRSSEKQDAFKDFIEKMSRVNFFVKREAIVNTKEGAAINFTKSVGVNTGEISTVKSTRGPDVNFEKQAAVQDIGPILRVKKSDTSFRYYIWGDMAKEYVHYKPLFGFDFGRPLLSPTLKKYCGEKTSQHTDGWVGAHNSFLYMIYRAGIVGVVMVLSLFFIWSGLLRDFYRLMDWTGLLLCAFLLNWIVSANFFLILELPYTAIPIWTILGVAAKHRLLLKKKNCPM